MYKLNAGTAIKVYAPLNVVSGPNNVVEGDTVYHDWNTWKDYVAKKDTVLDKHQVYDIVALVNGREDTLDWPFWITQNVRDGWTVFTEINNKGTTVWAMVLGSLEYLD